MAPQNLRITMSEAATVAPIVLWSDHFQGNLYLASKNSFLEIYTDKNEAMKRSAYARSASADSHFKCFDRSTQATTTPLTTPTNRSSSPSNRSMLSSANEVSPNKEIQSAGASFLANAYQYHDVNCDLMSANATYNDWDTGCDVTLMATMMPMQPYVNEAAPLAINTEDAVNLKDGDWDSARSMNTCMVSPADIPEFSSLRRTCRRTGASCENDKDMQPQVDKRWDSKGEKVSRVKFAPKQNLEKLHKTAAVTTLMIRGIPCSLSQEALISLIDDAGLKDKYNFFYLPTGRGDHRNSNLGYAFINFVDEPSAELFSATFQGVPLLPARSMKICTVSPADIQGLPSLWKHFRRTAVSRGSHGPLFLGGARDKYRNRKHAAPQILRRDTELAEHEAVDDFHNC